MLQPVHLLWVYTKPYLKTHKLAHIPSHNAFPDENESAIDIHCDNTSLSLLSPLLSTSEAGSPVLDAHAPPIQIAPYL